jgi:iron complex transport system substrate-binding protein
LGCRADVISLDPSTMDEVIACIGIVGDATGTGPAARTLMDQLRERVAAVRAAVAGRSRPRTLALEWSDPPFSGGHWVPEMIETAGGEPMLAAAPVPSRRLRWDEIAGASPETVVFMPCGYGLGEASIEGRRLLDVPELATAAHIYAVDASALFSRPGPRLVDGIETLAWALHPDAVPRPRAGALSTLR